MQDPSIYRRLVEQAKDYAVFVLDPAGNIATWNLGAERIKGYAPDEIIGKHFSVFYTREAVDAGWPAHELKAAAAEGRFEDEGWRVRKDGSRFWASVVITALRDDNGKLLGFSKITRDLTERKLYEESVRQSEERFRLLVEGVVDYAIFMLDPEGLVTSWNNGAQRLKQYTREEIVGKHFSRFYTPQDLEAGKPWEEVATARRTGRAEDQGWRVRKDGTRFWARVTLSALYDPQGHLRGFAKVTQDLSDRRHIQDLEQASRNVNEFIAMLAHELRNPIAPIRLALHVMERSPVGDPKHEAMRQTIDRQSAQLARIIDDMIDIAQITRGAIQMRRGLVDMAEAVRRGIETATPAIEASRHSLQVDLPTEPLTVDGDLHRLTQVVTNLLNNAARYTSPGGSITVRARAQARNAVVQVRDTGRGIEHDMIGRIFDMFVQGRTALQRVGSGLGVGLALSRRIAELHDGTLVARSEGENQGSEFTLQIPLARAAGLTPRQVKAETSAKAGVPHRILVVDDNIDAAMTLNALLETLGHETCVVYDGLSALQKAVEFRPDIVMLDIGMPGLDGYEVARRLQSLKKERPFRIVAVTGWDQETDRAKSREAGFDLHLVKPVDLDELARALTGRNGATLH
jgi:PAS domain S-box-containing protein